LACRLARPGTDDGQTPIDDGQWQPTQATTEEHPARLAVMLLVPNANNAKLTLKLVDPNEIIPT